MSTHSLMLYLKGTDPSSITDVIIIVLVFVFVAALVCRKLGKLHAFTSFTPSLLTSIGIIGTFAGIVVGLLEFEPSDIKGSIETLLSGLKVAFFTSLIGMILSVFYKALVSIGVLQSKEELELGFDEVGIEDLFKIMRKQEEGIAALRLAISDNDDSSLVGQIKLLRSELSTANRAGIEKFDAFANNLWIKLQDFADVLSKSATETVIDALKNVISDFNQNLTEQFGENFKELNAAVLKLVEWQDNYKLQLADMTEQYDKGVTAITETEKSLTVIEAKAGAIPESMAKLEELLNVNRHQLSDLGSHLSAFKDVREKAVNAVPEIQNQIDLVLAGVKTANEQISQGMQESTVKIKEVFLSTAEDWEANSQRTNAALIESSDTLSKTSDAIKEEMQATVSEFNAGVHGVIESLAAGGKSATDQIKKSGEELLHQSGRAQQDFDDGFKKMMLQFQTGLENMATEQQKQNIAIFNGLSTAIKNTLSETGESVTKQVEMIDASMAREVERVMSEMGRALASISGQFTADYSELVSEMRKATNQRAN